MGGWGEQRGPDPQALADRLAAAVRSFDECPSEANRERMMEAARAYERALKGGR